MSRKDEKSWGLVLCVSVLACSPLSNVVFSFDEQGRTRVEQRHLRVSWARYARPMSHLYEKQDFVVLSEGGFAAFLSQGQGPLSSMRNLHLRLVW